jgi:hypothetical protein
MKMRKPLKKRLTLTPLKFKDALRAILQTPPPAKRKRRKAK